MHRIKKHLEGILKNQLAYWSQPSFSFSAFLGLILLSGSLIINYFAGVYATAKAGNPVEDFLLSHLPQMNVRLLFVQGIIFFFIFVVCLLLYRPAYIPFVLKTVSLFIIIRSFFIILTHLGPVADHTSLGIKGIATKFTFGGDLFFSAHTGLPFLMALIFWNNKYLRYTFLFLSITFGFTVLLGHLHYSIDVFAAFFITYSIFHVAAIFFVKDYDLVKATRWWWLRRVLHRFGRK